MHWLVEVFGFEHVLFEAPIDVAPGDVVHRDPAAGTYSPVVVYSAHESVAPLAAPQAEFSIAAAGI